MAEQEPPKLTDLERHQRRLTLALAAKSREAYDLWRARYRSEDRLDEDGRKRAKDALDRCEKDLEDLEKEFGLVSRALGYETMATALDHLDEFRSSIAPLILQVDEHLHDRTKLEDGGPPAEATPPAERPKPTPPSRRQKATAAN